MHLLGRGGSGWSFISPGKSQLIHSGSSLGLKLFSLVSVGFSGCLVWGSVSWWSEIVPYSLSVSAVSDLFWSVSAIFVVGLAWSLLVFVVFGFKMSVIGSFIEFGGQF